MKKILVTGACSTIGNSISKAIIADGHCIFDVCRCSGIDLNQPQCLLDKIKGQFDGVVHVAECGLDGLRNLMLAMENKLASNHSIILISSVHHIFHDDVYARSKRDQESWIKNFALTNKSRANILRLGHIVGTKTWPVEDQSRLVEIPRFRFGNPEEVAEAVIYLLNAEWLCGSVLTLDGGMSLKA